MANKIFILFYLSVFLFLTIGGFYVREKLSQPIISPLAADYLFEPSIPDNIRQPINGQISWYSAEFDGFNCDDKDCIMANGRVYNPRAFTTACPSDYPLGSRFLVKHKGNSVEVVCTDRGAFKERYGRMLDLSPAAFSELAATSAGVLRAEILFLDNGGK